MKTILSLTKRNTLMFVKNRATVFFSLLSSLIIIGLYVIFLAENNIKGVQRLIPLDHATIAYLVNSWVMGGIIIVNSVTVTLGVLGIMVDDEARNRMPGFLVSPVSRFKLTSGYVFSAFIIGNVLCLITFFLAQLYIKAAGGSFLTIHQAIKAIGIIILSEFSSSCFVFFLISFIRTTSSYSTLSTIVGTLIGFIAGIYLPVGDLPLTVQKFIKYIPIFYDSSLMRDVFMTKPVSIVFKGTPPNVASSYLEAMGVKIYWGHTLVSNMNKIEIILFSGIGFLILSILVMRRRKMTYV